MSMINRREFVSAAALTTATLMTGLGAGTAMGGAMGAGRRVRTTSGAGGTPYPTFYLWNEVRPGVFVAMGRTGDDMTLIGGNATLVTGKKFQNVDACMIDTKQAVLGPSLRREALIKTGAITKVINTHHHFDHAGGNAAFKQPADGKAAPALLAHAKCCERVSTGIAGYTAQLDQKITALEALTIEGAKEAAEDAKAFRKRLGEVKPEAFIPEAMETDSVKELAGRVVEVHHVGAGHTDNDLFMFFPEDNVLVAGDLIFSGMHPYYDASAGANSKGWMRSLARIITLCNDDTVVVPGHGEVGTIAAVRAQIKYFEDVHSLVARAIEEKKSRDEVVKMAVPQHAGLGLKAAQGLVLGGVYDEMKQG